MHPKLGSLPPAFAYLPSLAAAPYGVALFRGPEHRTEWANAACQAIFGQPLLCGAPLFDHFPDLKQSAFAHHLDRSFQSGQAAFVSSPRLTPCAFVPHNETDRFLDLSFVPWRDEQQDSRGILLIAIDRFVESHAKARAEQSEAKLQALIESLPHAVFVSDAQGKVLFANRRWQNYTGTTPEKMHKSAWYKIVHPEDASAMWLQWNQRIGQRRFEVCARLKEHETGEYRWQQIVGLPIEHDSNGSANWIGTWTDLSKRVQQEEHQNELRLRFVSTISHDLRGPLTAIRTSAENIARHASDDKLVTKLERIVRTVDRTNDMLEELLNINVLHQDGLPRAEFVPTDLAAAMQLSLANFHSTFDGRLKVDMPKQIPGTWHASTLVRAIDNIIGNAFKYGDDKAPVTLRVRQCERHVKIEVHNQGRVLSAEEQHRIFAPYERLGQTDKQPHGKRGWGLGLSFVSDVARAHGGTVSVSSEANVGTTFQLRIPNDVAMRATGAVPTHAGQDELTPAAAADKGVAALPKPT